MRTKWSEVSVYARKFQFENGRKFQFEQDNLRQPVLRPQYVLVHCVLLRKRTSYSMQITDLSLKGIFYQGIGMKSQQKEPEHDGPHRRRRWIALR